MGARGVTAAAVRESHAWAVGRSTCGASGLGGGVGASGPLVESSRRGHIGDDRQRPGHGGSLRGEHLCLGRDSSPLPGQYAILAELRSGGRVQSRVYGHVQTTESRGPFVAPGSLPGLPATVGAPATDFSTLWVWLTQQASEGSFYWIHAPQCHPLTEAQLRRALDEAVDKGSLDCEADAPFFGWEVEKCTVLAGLPQASPYLARFGIGLDLLAATWDDLTQPSDPLTVRLRWWAQVPQEEVEVYLALRGDGDEVIWAEGGRRLLSDWGWAAPDWPVEAAVDTEAYIVLPSPWGLPPCAARQWPAGDAGHRTCRRELRRDGVGPWCCGGGAGAQAGC